MYNRKSQYYTGCDGVKLAVDIYIPDSEGKVPVILQAGYSDRRETFERTKEQLERFLDAGYAIALAEPRGHGASYGVSEGFFSPKDGRDMAAVIDAIADEQWCSGKVGMMGGSNMGFIQQLTLVHRPAALKAAIPCDANIDFYYQNYTNGACSLPQMPEHHSLDTKMGTPVDDDPAPDYPMAAEAAEQHRLGMGFLAQYKPNMFRDDVNHAIGYAPNLDIPVWERMDELRFGDSVIYHNGAWFDPGCTGAILASKYCGDKLLIGPWTHCEIFRGGSDLPGGKIDWVSDYIRFFDATLKDKNNGALTEPPVKYYTIGDAAGDEWHYAADFPHDSQTQPDFFLTDSGGLQEELPGSGEIKYKVVEDIKLFPGFGKLMRRIDEPMNESDKKGLSFATAAVDKDVELTGVPVLELYATSTHNDGIFVAVLEEVLPDGTSKFITDGAIRAAHAKIAMNPVRASLGLPYHRGYRADAVELSQDKPLQLAFNLEATSYIVKKGSKIQVSVFCSAGGYMQPDGFPDEPPTVTFHMGDSCPAKLRLPVIAPNVTKSTGDGHTIYAFKRAVYIYRGDSWECHPCKQVYPEHGRMVFVTEKFTAVREALDSVVTISLKGDGYDLTGTGTLPDRKVFGETSTEIKRFAPQGFPAPSARPYTYKNLYVATVPVGRGVYGGMNIQAVNTLDIHMNLILPENAAKPVPCVLYIHGFGGNQHALSPMTEGLLAGGCAVATMDYRLPPPSVWPTCSHDAKGAVRYLKANAKELGLDPERIAVTGESMGGHLTAMIAACNGDKATEGCIGGNSEFDSSVKAAVVLFGVTDLFGFGDDCAAHWPLRPDKVANGDGPFAPLGSLVGYSGSGKGMGNLKTHLYDKDPYYRELIRLATDASAVSHVTENSAPTALIHGIFESGIQVPMGQSLRMFEALTRKGVKSILLCNNNCMYGTDPEVLRAATDFILNRI